MSADDATNPVCSPEAAGAYQFTGALRNEAVEDARQALDEESEWDDERQCFTETAADLAKIPAVLALAANLHFMAGLHAEIAVSAAEQQLGIGYCRDSVQRRLYELGLMMFRRVEVLGEDG